MGNQGSIFSLINTVFTETNSIYYNNSALYGGVYYCENCVMSITNTVFTNHSAVYGGLIYGQEYVNVSILNSYITNTMALIDGGSMYLIETTAHMGVGIYLSNVTMDSSSS